MVGAAFFGIHKEAESYCLWCSMPAICKKHWKAQPLLSLPTETIWTTSCMVSLPDERIFSAKHRSRQKAFDRIIGKPSSKRHYFYHHAEV